MKQQRDPQQPALMAEMLRPQFGGLQYKPVDPCKGGWDLFRPTAATPATQPSLLDMIEDGYMHSEYGDCADLVKE